jgi:hypothetical protein
MLFTPRIHARYSITEKTSIKISSGKAYRSPQMVVDHLSALAGNRAWILPANATTDYPDYPFGFEMEEAVNSGIVLVHSTKLFHRTATFTVDAFHTNSWQITKQQELFPCIIYLEKVSRMRFKPTSPSVQLNAVKFDWLTVG